MFSIGEIKKTIGMYISLGVSYIIITIIIKCEISAYMGYVFPAVGQKSWWYFLMHGAPFIKSPRSSTPRATERAVHNICEIKIFIGIN